MDIVEAVKKELKQAEAILKEAEEAHRKGLYALSINSSEACLELCFKASSKLIGTSWFSLGLAERAKLLEDWIRRQAKEAFFEGEVNAEAAEQELKRAREAYEAVLKLLEEVEE